MWNYAARVAIAKNASNSRKEEMHAGAFSHIET